MERDAAFDAVAAGYDQEFTDTATGRLQRTQVYQHIKTLVQNPDFQNIIEINCGTGADALWLAQQGKQVLATDISPQMVAQVEQKREQLAPDQQALLKTQCLSATQLKENLSTTQPYDLLLSNFGGLNCLSPEELQNFLTDAAAIVRPGGCLALVIMGRFCWWESLYFLLKGKLKTAVRRLQKEPVSAQLDENTFVKTWYYSPKWVSTRAGDFEQIALHPIGFWLPPSYLDPFFKRRDSLLRRLNWLEQKTGGWSPLAYGADHYLLVLQRS